MAVHTGLVQYAATGDSYNQPIGIVTGGTWGLNPGAEKRTGVGGVGIWVPTRNDPAVTGLSIIPTTITNSPMGAILRTDYPEGATPDYKLEVGDDAVGIRLPTWRVNRAEIVWEVESPLTLTVDLLGYGKPTITTGGLTYTSLPTVTFECYRGSVLCGSGNYWLRRLSITVENNYTPIRSGNTKTAGSRLYPEALAVGPSVVSVEATVLVLPSIDLSGDALGDSPTISATVSNGTSTYTISIATPKMLSWETSFTGNDTLAEYTVRYALDDSEDGMTISTS